MSENDRDLSLLAECVIKPGAPAELPIGMGTINAACAWLRDNTDALRCILDLHGAVVLSGLPVRTPQDFGAVRDALLTERVSYREKATPRSNFGDDVYSSTDFPASQSIRAHNENSYTLTFPGLLMFGCLTAPLTGGATPVTDVRKVLRSLPGSLVDEFRLRGWSLVRNYIDDLGLSWTTAFGTDDVSIQPHRGWP